MNVKEIESCISKIPNFPKPGILYYDISSMIYNNNAFSASIETLAKTLSNYEVEKIAGIDARGFIFASALSYKLNKGLIMIRKKNKLPGKTISLSYDLEYGKDTLEINQNIKNNKIVVVDDLLATGGTGKATVDLISKSGGFVTCFLSLIELTGLKGREKFNIPVESIIQY